MSQWLLGAAVLAVCLVPCTAVCFYAGPLSDDDRTRVEVALDNLEKSTEY